MECWVVGRNVYRYIYCVFTSLWFGIDGGEHVTIDVNGAREDMSAMMISAERYALGRRTYIVQWTCEFIGNNLHLLSEDHKKVMIKDIEDAWYYGDKCDEYCWKELLKKLEGVRS